MSATFKHYSEKRNFIRIKVDNFVSYRLEGNKERYEGRCIDISGAGLLIKTSKKLQTGATLTITVPSPKNEFSNLNADVEVVRVSQLPEEHKYLVGVAIKKVLS